MSEQNPQKNEDLTVPSEVQPTPMPADLEAALKDAEAHAEHLGGAVDTTSQEDEAVLSSTDQGQDQKTVDETPSKEESTDASSTQLNQLKTELIASRKLGEEMRDGMIRARADLENARRRFDREQKEAQIYASEKVLKAIIPVVDDLDRALDNVTEDEEGSLVEGVKLVHRKFLQTLESQGAVSFYPIGELFDPTSHEALMEMPTTEHPEGHITQVFQRGWRLKERLLRPAKVIIAKAP